MKQNTDRILHQKSIKLTQTLGTGISRVSIVKVLITFSSAFSCFQHRNKFYYEKMTSNHHKNLENFLEKLKISDGSQNRLRGLSLPMTVTDFHYNEATLFAAYCFIRNFIG